MPSIRRTSSRPSPAPEKPDNDASKQPPPIRLIYKKELCEWLGLSFVTIWRLIRQGLLPPPRILGGKSVWFEHEINERLAQLPVRRYKKKAPPDAGAGKEKS
jgi:predicted DNA-binding transcriptional regulator AlpA